MISYVESIFSGVKRINRLGWRNEPKDISQLAAERYGLAKI